MKTLLKIILLATITNANALSMYEDRIENIQYLSITDGSYNNFQSIYDVCINVSKNATLQINSQAELTTFEWSYNVGLGRFLHVTEYKDTYCKSSGKTRSRTLTPAVMSNITPSEHHHVINISYALTNNSTDTKSMRFSLVAYAASDGANGNVLRVEQGYGYLQVLR